MDKNMNDIVLIRDLPPSLVEDASKGLAQYTIAFLDVKNVSNSQQVNLLGSGVLISDLPPQSKALEVS